MNSNKIKNLSDGIEPTDAVNLGQLQQEISVEHYEDISDLKS